MEKTEAIVVQVTPYGETTLMARLLTPEMGVVRVLAKGARRPGRNTQAVLEPLAWIQAEVFLKDPDALGTLGEATLREGWNWLRSDLTRLAYAGLGIEVLSSVAALSPPEPAFFIEACSFLRALGDVKGAGSLTVALLLRLLHHGGFPPRLAEPWTPETLPAGPLLWRFDTEAFARAASTDPAASMSVDRATVAALMPAFCVLPELDGSFALRTAQGRTALRWLVRVWEDHLGRPLKAARFLEEMVLGPPRPKG